MNKKTLAVLAVIATLAALLAVVGQRVDRGTGDSNQALGTALVENMSDRLNSIERIVLTGAGNETLVSLERQPDGWVVAEQDGYAADVGQIRNSLVQLAEARLIEEKTSNPAFYSRLGVESVADETASGIMISFEGDEVFPAVILGGDSGASYRFARRADEATSYLIDRNPELPRDSAQWVQPEIIDVPSARIQRVEITHSDGEQLVISKQSPEATSFDVQNVPEDRDLQYATVANVIGNSLRELQLEQAARIDPEPPDPAVETRFWTFDGLVVTVTGMVYDDVPWVSFSTSFDPDQALRFASDPAEDSRVEETPSENSESPAANREAEELEDRLSGWRFRIPSYQHDQMTRRMDDLLAAQTDDDTE